MVFLISTMVFAHIVALVTGSAVVADAEQAEEAMLESMGGDLMCDEYFDRCWDGTLWKATPSCSGVPSTWEALLFADGMESMCNPESLALLGGSGCSKVLSMCEAREELHNRGCKMSTELKELKSGDTIYLRGYTGMLFDVNNGAVQARWKDHGVWETLVINKRNDGPIMSGDTVTIQTHEGSYIDVSGPTVRAAMNQSSRQQLIVEKIGEGPVRSGDAIFLKTHEGTYIDVEGENVTAMEEKGGNQQVILVERELPYKDATNINFGRNCDEDGPSPQDIRSGATVYFRTSSGKLLDATDQRVRARRDDFGDIQAFVVETNKKGPIHSGDDVFLKTHDGTLVGAEDDVVRAKWNDRSEVQSLQITKTGGGVIQFGDTVNLNFGDGKTIDINSTGVVKVMANQSGSLEGFSIEKGKWSETMGFLHIPKNAGTAIEDAAWEHDIRWGRWLMFGMFNVDGDSWCSTHHVPPQWLPAETQARYTDMENFCITRHPYTRAVSEYSYVLSQTMDLPNKEQKEPQLYRYTPCTSEALNHYLQHILQKVLDGPGKFLNDCHFIPQSEYLWDDDHQWCAHILRMEELPNSFNDLMQSKGYPVRLDADHHNKTNAHGELCPGLNASVLDESTKALLDKAYAVDFRRLGYSRELPQ